MEMIELFGKQWEKEIMKFKKSEIINLLRKACKLNMLFKDRIKTIQSHILSNDEIQTINDYKQILEDIVSQCNISLKLFYNKD